MHSGQLVISSSAVVLAFVFLLYLPVGIFSLKAVFPRLSSTARHLAGGMLAIQVFVIALAFGLLKSESPEVHLWALNWEENFSTILASAQLALVGGVALVTMWVAKRDPIWMRFYFLCAGLTFVFLAVDEFYLVHERIRGWERYYAILGATIVAATLLVATHVSQAKWIWHICVIIGLAVGASGGIVVEQLRFQAICWNSGFIRLDNCLPFYPFEETLEFLGIWIVLVGMLGLLPNSESGQSRYLLRALYALPLLWALALFQTLFLDIIELQVLAKPSNIQFESRVHLYGYRVEREGSQLNLRLYPALRLHDYHNLAYTVDLVDQASGDILAKGNRYANKRPGFLKYAGYEDIHRQQLTVQFPSNAPTNRAYWVVLKLWRERDGDYIPQKVLSSDRRLLTEAQVVLEELALPAPVSPAAGDPLARFSNGFALEFVDMPAAAMPGATLPITFGWRSDADGREDHAQFLHLGHAETGEYFVYDQLPLGDRLPTRLWYAGLADSETWRVQLPAALASGEYRVFTGLYRVSDGERVPVTDTEGVPWLDNRIALGDLTIAG